MTGIHKLTTGQDIIGLLILLVMCTVIWSNEQYVVILVDGLELLVLTLPEEMNVQLDGTRAHKRASVSVDHQVTMLDTIFLQNNKICGMAKGDTDAFLSGEVTRPSIT